jgi:NAD(P)-dependent dehydrogenase (short-subunit alcohol dehydrogenase family)
MEDKIIILTGGSRGIGHATSKKFWDNGWTVITCSRSSVAIECPWRSQKHNHFKVDLEDTKSLDKVMIDLTDFLDVRPVKALINNAAVSPKSDDNSRLGFLETPIDLWKEVFNVNFFAPIIISKAVYQNLKLAQGMIINITSIASDSVHQFAGPAYATSKAALKSLTREMASDLGQHGIRVNSIAPGEIETSMVSENSRKLLTNKIPMGRFGTPDEVASVVHSMCSDSFSYLNGTEIQVNGGQTV